MFIHNIIIAVRNIWKYKTQNLISILGLSVALLCFSVCLYCTDTFIVPTHVLRTATDWYK